MARMADNLLVAAGTSWGIEVAHKWHLVVEEMVWWKPQGVERPEEFYIVQVRPSTVDP